MSRVVQQYFDRRASAFDAIYLEESRWKRWVNHRFRRAIYERFRLALEAAGDVRGRSVLDVGCGPGHYLVAFARQGAARIVGVDLSPRMLELARGLLEREGVVDRCRLLEGDFLALDFPERFDVALAMGVFDYLRQPVPFLRKMARVASGTVLATFPGRAFLRRIQRRIRYRLCGCPVFFYSAADLRNLAAAAGLRDFDLVPVCSPGMGHLLVARTGSEGR